MATFLFIVILCTLYSLSFSFHIRHLIHKPFNSVNKQRYILSHRSYLLQYFMVQDDQQLIQVKNIAVDGIISEANGFSDLQLAQTLHKKDGVSHIRLLVDDLAFAKKRLVSPDTVYSGLLDAMELVEVSRSRGDTALYQEALGKCESFIAFNVSLDELPSLAGTATMKRAVIAVLEADTPGEEQQHTALEDAALLFKSKDVKYTFLRYNAVKEGPEARLPFRIVRGTQTLPGSSSNQQSGLLSGSLFRVLSEVVDLPKTYDGVYGIGPGTALDAEIATHMNSRGWSERVQVGVLMGDLMQTIEEKVQQEHTRQRQQKAAAVAKKTAQVPADSSTSSISKDQSRMRTLEQECSKFAGFF